MSPGTEIQGPSRRGESESEIRVGWKMSGLGMEVAAQVAAGAMLGWLFDRWRGTGSTGLLVGAVIGIVVGLGNLIRGALKLNRELERHSPTAGRTTAPPRENVERDGDTERDE